MDFTFRTDIGTAVHNALHYIDFACCIDSASIQKEIDRLVASKLISSEEAAFISADKLAAMFETPLGKRMRSGAEVVWKESTVFSPSGFGR